MFGLILMLILVNWTMTEPDAVQNLMSYLMSDHTFSCANISQKYDVKKKQQLTQVKQSQQKEKGLLK